MPKINVRDRKANKRGPIPLYRVEFPDFGDLPFDPTQYGLTDTSWHNDVCPSFSIEKCYVDQTYGPGTYTAERLWINYADKSLREMDDMPRFLYETCTHEHSEPLEILLHTEDPEEAKQFLFRRASARLGDAFADVLRKWLTRDQFAEMCKRNGKHTGDGCCASHDFCDANMAMDAAMRDLGFGGFMRGDWVTKNEHLRLLWNAAWDYAKVKHLTGEAFMTKDAAHAEAAPLFTAARFWLEDFLGVFMYDFKDGRTLTCAFDWADNGLWCAQVHGEDGEDLGGEDFATPAEVIAYRDKLEVVS